MMGLSAGAVEQVLDPGGDGETWPLLIGVNQMWQQFMQALRVAIDIGDQVVADDLVAR